MSKTLGRLLVALSVCCSLTLTGVSSVAAASSAKPYIKLVSAYRTCAQPNRITGVTVSNMAGGYNYGISFVFTEIGGKYGAGAGYIVKTTDDTETYPFVTGVVTDITNKPVAVPDRPLVASWSAGEALSPTDGSGTVTIQPPNCRATATTTTTTTTTATPSATKVVITTKALRAGHLNKHYSFKLIARGGSGSYTWKPMRPLPKALRLVRSGATAGTITGTPRKSGTFTVAMKVIDSAGHASSKRWTLHIAA